MVNFNGVIQENATLTQKNRAFKYADAVFETLKVVKGSILFFEDHYFRLMASMRILRMEIPMAYTMDNIQFEINKLLRREKLLDAVARVRLTVYRDAEGYYNPTSNSVGFVIEATKLASNTYELNASSYVVGLFKDHYITPQLLSSIKTTNRVINVIAGVYATENEWDNAFLVNTDKKVIEAINGNVFLVKGTKIKTPPLADGCIRGIMRKQIIALLEKHDSLQIEEASIMPFELQQADELFITNVIQGVVSVSNYRKKTYTNTVANLILDQINKEIIQ